MLNSEHLAYIPDKLPGGSVTEVHTEIDPTPPQRNWVELVKRIQRDDPGAMEELYQCLTRGMRYYLFRMLGPQDLEDRLHDCFLVVARAVQRGEVREPERLMGFARTVVRRQIGGHIESAIRKRRCQVDIDEAAPLSSTVPNPEMAAISQQREQLAASVLRAINYRDREILTRFYLDEQSQYQICKDMSLTPTQFRLLKSRAKARFGELGRRQLSHHNLRLD